MKERLTEFGGNKKSYSLMGEEMIRNGSDGRHRLGDGGGKKQNLREGAEAVRKKSLTLSANWP